MDRRTFNKLAGMTAISALADATLVMLLLLVPATIAVAQQTDSPQQTSPDSGGATLTLHVTSRLTLVDVTATDSKGKPVHGLTQSDFTIKEDGKPQAIRNFEEHSAEKPTAQAAEPPLPPNIYTNAEPPPTTSAVNVLMLDDVTTGVAEGVTMHPQNMMYAREKAIKYLKAMPAGTQFIVLEMANGLRVMQGLTSDRGILLAAINPIAYKPVSGAFLIPSPGPGSAQQACFVMNTQSEIVLSTLEQAAAFLSGIKGRKNLIWFTPGIPWLTAYGEFAGAPCTVVDYTAELQRVYGLLTEARVALYPVDPRGLVGCPPLNCLLPEDHNSMNAMAEATGGAAYYNRNDLDAAVAEAVATGSDYYSLSYVPPLSKYDGQYHRIDVKVDRPGVHLQYREGYTAIDLTKPAKPPKKTAERSAPPPSDFEVAMSHGVAPSTELLFDVRVAPVTSPARPSDPQVIGKLSPAIKKKALVRYYVQYFLNPDQITLLDGADNTRNTSVVLDIAVYDDAGKLLNIVSKQARSEIKAGYLARFPQKPISIPLRINLPPDHISVRVGVLDLPSGRIGTLEVPVSVGKPKK